MEQSDDESLSAAEFKQQESGDFLLKSVLAILQDEVLFHIDIHERGPKPYVNIERESFKRMMNRILVRLLDSNKQAVEDMIGTGEPMLNLKRRRYQGFQEQYLHRKEYFGGEEDPFSQHQRVYIMQMARELAPLVMLHEEIIPNMRVALEMLLNKQD